MNDVPLFITGESYAGKYIPLYASHIIKYNENTEDLYIPLKGVMIGNPLVSPAI